jgi:hypothetical protein
LTRGIKTGRRKGKDYRGGLPGHYIYLENDLTLWMKEDQNTDAWFTTMVDLYALPEDFPGHATCKQFTDPLKKVRCLEDGLSGKISHRRFIPYIQLHEFEALLFSEPAKFDVAFPDSKDAVQQLQKIRDESPSPEHIDDRPEFAPSKRILKLLPDYRKPVAGPTIAASIGLATLRRECPHFNQWICKIEALAL